MGVKGQFFSLEKRLKYPLVPQGPLCFVSMRSLLECDLSPKLEPLSFLPGKRVCAVGMQGWGVWGWEVLQSFVW